MMDPFLIVVGAVGLVAGDYAQAAWRRARAARRGDPLVHAEREWRGQLAELKATLQAEREANAREVKDLRAQLRRVKDPPSPSSVFHAVARPLYVSSLAEGAMKAKIASLNEALAEAQRERDEALAKLRLVSMDDITRSVEQELLKANKPLRQRDVNDLLDMVTDDAERVRISQEYVRRVTAPRDVVRIADLRGEKVIGP